MTLEGCTSSAEPAVVSPVLSQQWLTGLQQVRIAEHVLYAAVALAEACKCFCAEHSYGLLCC